MTVKPPARDQQLPLLEVPPSGEFGEGGSARARYGQAVQEIVQRVLRLRPIENSGDFDVVFDAFSRGIYYEIKSVRRTSSIPIYKWRLEKEANAPVSLAYLIATHNVAKARTQEDLWQGMSETLNAVYEVPHALIRKLVKGRKLRHIQSPGPHGYNRTGYCEGYHLLPASEIRGLPAQETRVKSLNLYGYEFSISHFVVS